MKHAQALWAEDILAGVERKAETMARKARNLRFIPYTVEKGDWRPGPMDGNAWWTNGFYPALFWQLYAGIGKEAYRDEAIRAQKILDEAFLDFQHLHHDVGFMWRISSGFQYDLTGDQAARGKTLYAAHLLQGRYNPNGFFRAWNGDRVGWAIIDCMMNLPILYFAARETGDPRFSLAAEKHTETVIRHFLREDGASEHIVIFDPADGRVMERPAGQGYAPGSEWARGQGWAIYGLSLAGRHLHRPDFLDAAAKTADHALERLGESSLCPVDFLQPAEPWIYDDCATAIIACGLMDLAEQTTEMARGEKYRGKAFRMLQALAEEHADWTEENPAILTRCTGSYNTKDHEIPMIYGDYFFTEGVLRLTGRPWLRW